MSIEFIEFGKKGNSEEIKEILSHIFQRNNDLSKQMSEGQDSPTMVFAWVRLPSARNRKQMMLTHVRWCSGIVG